MRQCTDIVDNSNLRVYNFKFDTRACVQTRFCIQFLTTIMQSHYMNSEDFLDVWALDLSIANPVYNQKLFSMHFKSLFPESYYNNLEMRYEVLAVFGC